MKHILTLTLLLMFSCALTIEAQKDSSGLYRSYDQWHARQPMYSLNCDGKSPDEIKNADLLGTGLLILKIGKEKIRLNTDTLFGWANCSGTLFRFQARESYTVLEKGPVWVYEKLDRIQDGKSHTLENHFFFSLNGQTEILPLTKATLKKALPGRLQLHLMIDMLFHADEDAAIFDTHANMFKINALLSVYPY